MRVKLVSLGPRTIPGQNHSNPNLKPSLPTTYSSYCGKFLKRAFGLKMAHFLKSTVGNGPISDWSGQQTCGITQNVNTLGQPCDNLVTTYDNLRTTLGCPRVVKFLVLTKNNPS